MNRTVSKSQSLVKNTHIVTKRRFICWNKKPCYRIASCEHCWKRQKKYLRNQMPMVAIEWQLVQMITINVFTPFKAYKSKVAELIKLRPKILRGLKRYSKFIAVVAIHADSENANAHYHILTAALSKDKIQALIARWIIYPFNIQVSRFYEPVKVHSINCLNYLLKNLKVTLPCKPENKQLLTASSGFYTGRPKTLTHVKLEKFAWLI